jgi:hypothetical protein
MSNHVVSWAEGRQTPGVQKGSDDDKKLEAIRVINGILKKHADDEDLQDDLKLPQVKLALDHWAGIRRLPPEQYLRKLENDLRVQSVYPKLKMLQAACNDARMPLPLDHFVQGKDKLDTLVLTRTFGTDFCIAHRLTRPQTPRGPQPGAFEDSGVDNDDDDDDDDGRHEEKIVTKQSTSSQARSVADGSRPADVEREQDLPPLIDMWRILRDSWKQTDLWDTFVRAFKQQLLAFIATIVVAYYLGFFPLDELVQKYADALRKFLGTGPR